MARSLFGLLIEASIYKPQRDLVVLDTSPSGNLVLRVGQENDGMGYDDTPTGGYHRVAHVVLTPDEAEEFALEILRKLDRNQFESLYLRATAARDEALIEINDAAVMRLVDAAIG